MEKRKRIALIAHDHLKPALVDWARQHIDILREHDLCATGTTGSRLEKELGLEVVSIPPDEHDRAMAYMQSLPFFIARALVSRPEVVFGDEPTGNLDSKSSGEVMSLLRRSVDEFGQTVIMVTHDPTAASYADRLLVLADGQIVHDGEAHTAEDVLDLMKAVG